MVLEGDEMTRMSAIRTARETVGSVAIVAMLVVALGCFGIPSAVAEEEQLVGGDANSAEADSAIILRGAEIGEAPSVALSDVIEDPEKYAKQPVIIEGTVTEVCQTKGCWMKVVPDTSKTGVRVTFKDYGFFVPMTSTDWLVRAEGVFQIKVWTKDEADHLEGEGAKFTRNADGTATEIGFVATGVELRPEPAPAEASKESP
jgi:hypothetical protein